MLGLPSHIFLNPHEIIYALTSKHLLFAKHSLDAKHLSVRKIPVLRELMFQQGESEQEENSLGRGNIEGLEMEHRVGIFQKQQVQMQWWNERRGRVTAVKTERRDEGPRRTAALMDGIP